MPVDSPRKLFMMGFVTNLLNPGAMLYLALLPQFIDPARGSVLLQSLVFGTIQIVISASVHVLIALTRRLDHGISRRAPGMAQGPALDDGHRACRFRAAHGLRQSGRRVQPSIQLRFHAALDGGAAHQGRCTSAEHWENPTVPPCGAGGAKPSRGSQNRRPIARPQRSRGRRDAGPAA